MIASAAFCDTGMRFRGERRMFCANAVGRVASESIFSSTVCDFRDTRSVLLICKRCKTKVNLRVEALSLWRRVNVSSAQRTLCGDCSCRSALAAAPCECLELGEPSTEIVCVKALSLRRANVWLFILVATGSTTTWMDNILHQLEWMKPYDGMSQFGMN